jgi:hypothetical protein
MKAFVGAALAALLLASPAIAQYTTPPTSTATAGPSQCAAAPEAPSMPDGASANRAAMVAANERFTAWVAASQTYLECVRLEADAAAATYTARRDTYNTGRDSLRTAVESWTAETAEFNSRSGQGPSRAR